jgi:hypothetical protein
MAETPTVPMDRSSSSSSNPYLPCCYTTVVPPSVPLTPIMTPQFSEQRVVSPSNFVTTPIPTLHNDYEVERWRHDHDHQHGIVPPQSSKRVIYLSDERLLSAPRLPFLSNDDMNNRYLDRDQYEHLMYRPSKHHEQNDSFVSDAQLGCVADTRIDQAPPLTSLFMMMNVVEEEDKGNNKVLPLLPRLSVRKEYSCNHHRTAATTRTIIARPAFVPLWLQSPRSVVTHP